jgi:hypothetical protein
MDNLLAGYYSVCNFCKEGRFNLINDEHIDFSFEEQHVAHGAIEIVPAQKFLSDNLSSQYIDVDRPTLLPIGTSLGPVKKTDIIDSFKTSVTNRNKYRQIIAKENKPPFETVEDEYIPKLQK